MIPSEYRLEQVTARLTERLESTRRTYAGDEDGARTAFRTIAGELLDDAVSEFRADGFTDRPERHEAFLRREVIDTFLPRYTREALAQTAREGAGYGLGWLYGAAGRIAIACAGALLLFLMLRAPGPWGVKLAPLLPVLVGIFVPDVLAWASQRTYRRALVSTLDDMRVIQERAGDYLPAGASSATPAPTESQPAATRRRPQDTTR